MTINGQVIDNFWSGVPDLQEWMVRIVLNELNIAIHAWVDSPDQYSQRLENSGRILRLFGMLERLGMHAEIPEVTWDVRRHAGIVLDGPTGILDSISNLGFRRDRRNNYGL
jgi:hypothetical protein